MKAGGKSSGTVIYERLIFLLGNPSRIKLPSFFMTWDQVIFFFGFFASNWLKREKNNADTFI